MSDLLFNLLIRSTAQQVFVFVLLVGCFVVTLFPPFLWGENEVKATRSASANNIAFWSVYKNSETIRNLHARYPQKQYGFLFSATQRQDIPTGLTVTRSLLWSELGLEFLLVLGAAVGGSLAYRRWVLAEVDSGSIFQPVTRWIIDKFASKPLSLFIVMIILGFLLGVLLAQIGR